MAFEVKELEVSNDALNDPAELRSRIGETGYLFFRNLVDKGLLWDLRLELLNVCQQGGWIQSGTNIADGLVDVSRRCAEGDLDYSPIYTGVQKVEAFHRIAHHPAFVTTIHKIVDGEVLVQPQKVARLWFPQFTDHTTPPHQDFVHFQGDFDTYTCWTPVGDCPIELGGLAILVGSHKRNTVLDHHFSLGAGGLRVNEEDQQGEWVSTDFEIGDCLIFHSLTVHQALPNLTQDRLRVSLDNRYQAVDVPISESQIKPHLSRLTEQTWEDIYAGWQTSDLRYYWRDLNLEVSPSDLSRHERGFAEALELARQGVERARPALERAIERDPYSPQAKEAVDALRELDAAIKY